MGSHEVEIIKGWTRSTVVATILAAAGEVDLADPNGIELLKPLFPVLDKCWLVPVHVTCCKSHDSRLWVTLLFSPVDLSKLPGTY